MRLLGDQFAAARDPLGMGDVGRSRQAMGSPLTLGQAFPYAEGGTLLRRKRIEPQAQGEWIICGYARPGAVEIDSDDGVAHGYDAMALLVTHVDPPLGLLWPFPDRRGAFWYSAARVLGNGQAGDWSSPVRIDFDIFGRVMPLMPTWPAGVSAMVP